VCPATLILQPAAVAGLKQRLGERRRDPCLGLAPGSSRLDAAGTTRPDYRAEQPRALLEIYDLEQSRSNASRFGLRPIMACGR
jgi:hypothetical protein